MTITHYEMLGVQNTDTIPTIRAAYKKLAAIWHADKAAVWAPADRLPECAAIYLRMREAYETLTNEQQRQQYDNQLVYSKRFPLTQAQVIEKEAFQKKWDALKSISDNFSQRQSDPLLQIAYLQKQLHEQSAKCANAAARATQLEEANKNLEKRNRELDAECRMFKDRLFKSQRVEQPTVASQPLPRQKNPGAIFENSALDIVFGKSHQCDILTDNIRNYHAWSVTLPLDTNSAEKVINAAQKIQKSIIKKITSNEMIYLYLGLVVGDSKIRLDVTNKFQILSVLATRHAKNDQGKLEIRIDSQAYGKYIAPNLGKQLAHDESLSDFLNSHFAKNANSAFRARR